MTPSASTNGFCRGSRPSGLFILLAASLFILAGLLLTLALAAADSRTPVWRLVALAMTAHVPYAAVLLVAWKIPRLVSSLWVVIAISVALRLILVPAPPVFSDDIYRYIWDGRVLTAGNNPYQFSPEHPELEPLRDPSWNQINNRSLNTIYPPLAQAYFAVITLISPHTLAFKLASTGADVTVTCLIMLLAGGQLRRKKHAPNRHQPKRAAWAGLVYGLNPLVCIETGMSGHLEPFAIALLLSALLLWQKKQNLVSPLVLGLGAGVKLIPVLMLPVMARRRPLSWLVFPGVLIGLYLPFISAGTGLISTLDAFARRWESNAGLFAVVKSGIQVAISWLSGVQNVNGMVHIPLLDPVARALENTFFSLHKDGGFDPLAPGAFTLNDLSLFGAKLIMGMGLIFVIAHVTYRRLPPVKAAAWILSAFIIATPVLHPWYLLWVLPLASVFNIWPFFVLAACMPMTYLHLDDWWASGVWQPAWWIPWLEYGMFALAIVLYLARMRSRHDK